MKNNPIKKYMGNEVNFDLETNKRFNNSKMSILLNVIWVESISYYVTIIYNAESKSELLENVNRIFK